jgi:tRNA(Arg) A34 adenosine deaminase TadA
VTLGTLNNGAANTVCSRHMPAASRGSYAVCGAAPHRLANAALLHGSDPLADIEIQADASAMQFGCRHNLRMTKSRLGEGLRRRSVLVVLPWLGGAAAADQPLQLALRRADAMRDAALRAGDQPYGAVVLRGESIVGAAPSRVVTANDPTAHAEMEAIRDAARHLRTRDLSGCVLVSTSRPCRMCEAAAGWAGIVRMVYGEALTDAGPPR